MKKLFKRLLPLCLVICIILSNTTVAYAGITDMPYLPGKAKWGRTGYGYRIGLGICSNELYTGPAGDTESLAQWIYEYGSKYYVHAQGNPYYVTQGAGINGFTGYKKSDETPCNIPKDDSVVTSLINEISSGGTEYLLHEGSYSYINPDRIEDVIDALGPTAPDLYATYLTQKNATNFHPVVIVVESVIGMYSPDGEHYAIDCYDLYNWTPTNVACGDLLTTDLRTVPSDEVGSKTGGLIVQKAGFIDATGNRVSGCNYDLFIWRLVKGMFNCSYRTNRVIANGPSDAGYGAGALLCVQDAYNEGGTAQPDNRIDGCYIINIGMPEVTKLSGSYTWHIDADDLAASSSGHQENNVARLSVGTTSVQKNCTINSFDLSQSNYGDWVNYFTKNNVTSVKVNTEIYHTGLGNGGSTFSCDYNKTSGQRSGAFANNTAPLESYTTTMDADAFLEYLKPDNTDDFPVFAGATETPCVLGTAPVNDMLGTAFATKITVDLGSKTVVLANSQCNWALYEVGAGKYYKYLQLIDDSSTQVKTSQLDDSTDPYEAMAGTPTTENLFISQGANQWVVNMQYRYVNDDYKRTYHLYTDPVPNYLYYEVGAGNGGGSFKTTLYKGKDGHSNASDDTAGHYAYIDNNSGSVVDNDHETAYKNTVTALRDHLIAVQNSYMSNHTQSYSDGSSCHYSECTMTGLNTCSTCTASNSSQYDEINALITTLNGYITNAASDTQGESNDGTTGDWDFVLFSTGNANDLDTNVGGDVTMSVSLSGGVSTTADSKSTTYYTDWCTGGSKCDCGGNGTCSGKDPSPKHSGATGHAHNTGTHIAATGHTAATDTDSGCYKLPEGHTCTNETHVAACYSELNCTNELHTSGAHGSDSCTTDATCTHYGSQHISDSHNDNSIFDGNTWKASYSWSVTITYGDNICHSASGDRGQYLSEDTTLTQTFEDVKYMDIVDYHVWQLVGGKQKGLGALLANTESETVFDLACQQKGYTLYNVVHPDTSWGSYIGDEGSGEHDTLVWRYVPDEVGNLASIGRLANSFSIGSTREDSPTLTQGVNVEGYAWTPMLMSDATDTVELYYDTSLQGGRSHKSFDAYLHQALAPVFYKSSNPADAYRNFIAVESDFLSLEYDGGILTFCALQYNTDEYSDGEGMPLYQAVMLTNSNNISRFFTDNASTCYEKGTNTTPPITTNPSGVLPQSVSKLKDLQEYAYEDGKVHLNDNDLYAEYTRLDLNGDEEGQPSGKSINTTDATSFTNIRLLKEESMPYVGLRSAANSDSESGHATFKNYLPQSFDPAVTFVNGGRSGVTFGTLSTPSAEVAASKLITGTGTPYLGRQVSDTIVEDDVPEAFAAYPRSAWDAYNVERTKPNNSYATGYAITLFDKVLSGTDNGPDGLKSKEGLSISMYDAFVDCHDSMSTCATEFLEGTHDFFTGELLEQYAHPNGIVHGSGYIGSDKPVNNVVVFNPVSATTASVYLGSSVSDIGNIYVTDGHTEDVDESNLQVIRDQRVAPYIIHTDAEDDVLLATKPTNIDLSETVTEWKLRVPSLYPTTYYTENDYINRSTSFKELIGAEPYVIPETGSYYLKQDGGVLSDYHFVTFLNSHDSIYLEETTTSATMWLRPATLSNITLAYPDIRKAVVNYYVANPTATMSEAFNEAMSEYNTKVEEYVDVVHKCRSTVSSCEAEVERLKAAIEDIENDNEDGNLENMPTVRPLVSEEIEIGTGVEIKPVGPTVSLLDSLKEQLVTAELELEDAELALKEAEDKLSSVPKPILDTYVDAEIGANAEGLNVPANAKLYLDLSGISAQAGAVVELALPVECANNTPALIMNSLSDSVNTYDFYDSENEILYYYIEVKEDTYLTSIGIDFKSASFIPTFDGTCLTFKDIMLFNINKENESDVISSGTIEYNYKTTSSQYKDSTSRASVYNGSLLRTVSEQYAQDHYAAGDDFNLYYIGNSTKSSLSAGALQDVHKVWNKNWRYYVVGWKTANGDVIESIDSELLDDESTLLRWPWASARTEGGCITIKDIKDYGVLVMFDGKIYLTTFDAAKEHIIKQTNQVVSSFDYINLCNSTHQVNLDNAEENVYPLRNTTDKLLSGAYEFCFKVDDADGYLYDVSKATNPIYRMSKDDYDTDYLVSNGFTYNSDSLYYEKTVDGNKLQFKYNYELDWKKDTYTLNSQTTVTGGGEILNKSNYISLDDVFHIYWDNTGKFAQGGARNIASPSTSLGYGWDTGLDNSSSFPDASGTAQTSKHVLEFENELSSWFNSRGQNDTETSKWIKDKYISFNFPVYVFTDVNGNINPTLGPFSTVTNDDGSKTKVANGTRYYPAGSKIPLGVGTAGDEADNNGGFKDFGAPGVTSYETPYVYTFWCPLEATESFNAIANCTVTAINDDSEAVSNSNATNASKGFSPFARYGDAVNKMKTAIVGRIGALTVVDSGDINYSDSFKFAVDETDDASIDDYYIYPLIRKVAKYSNEKYTPNASGELKLSTNAGKQKNILLDPFDVRGRLADKDLIADTGDYNTYSLTTDNNLNDYNTYGSQWFKRTDSTTVTENKGAVKSVLPLNSDFNIHPALKNTEQKLGYELYLSLESIGCYFGTSNANMSELEGEGYVNGSGDYNQRKVQIRPVYVAYNASDAKGDTYKGPVDVYMNMGGTYVQINSGEVAHTVTDDEGNESLDFSPVLRTTYNSYYPYNIETNTGVNEKNLDQNMLRRMVTEDESEITYSILNNDIKLDLTSLLSNVQTKQEGLGTTNMNNSYVYGNAQYLFLRERNRTFVGGKSIAVKEPSNYNESNELLTGLHGQKWYFGLGLPASAVFIPAGESFTADKILKTGYIVSSIDVYAVGDVWTLHYESPLSEVDLFDDEENTSIRDLTGNIPEFEWLVPVSFYNLENSTSRDDLDTEGSH